MTGADVVTFVPGMCGGHPTLKGHRVEVHNFVQQLHTASLTASQWIARFDASEWITSAEVVAAVEFCARRGCDDRGSYCCGCALNTDAADAGNLDRGSETQGWVLARELLVALRREGASSDRG